MQTINYSRRLTVAGSILLACAATNVAHAQLLKLVADDIGGSDGSLVSSWANTGSGGSGLNVSAVSGEEPTLVLNQGVNNHAAVRFDGNNDFLSAAGVLGSSLISATESATIAVVKSSGNYGSIVSWVDVFPNFYQVSENAQVKGVDAPEDTLLQNHGAQGLTTTALENSSWHVVTMIRNSDNSASIRVDGNQVASGTISSSITTSQTGTLGVGGSAFGPTDRWTGDLAELRVYGTTGSVLSDEAALINTYLTPVPEPSQYATVFSLVCVAGALVYRQRRQRASAA